MKIDIVILDESKCDLDRFYPFSILHPIFEIRYGGFRYFERIAKLFPKAKLQFEGRAKHIQSFLERFELENNSVDITLKEATLKLFCNALITKNITEQIENLADGNYYILANGQDIAEIDYDSSLPYKTIEVETQTYDSIWDLLYINDEALKSDASLFPHSKIDESKFPGVYFINKENIYLGKNITIKPGCVIDASGGTVIIGDNVTIMSQATIIGSCHIATNTTIKIGAKIYEKTSIGEWCKIGGEIENSIIQSYSNKQHEGFLGHSFLSEWVNLGAGTNNSDLKNTYGNIELRIDKKLIDTQRMFVGLFCGDHTKSAIGSLFTTGTMTGICGVLVNTGFFPNYIPSFAWGGKLGSPIYKISKALETAHIVATRRNKKLTPTEIELIELEYEKMK